MTEYKAYYFKDTSIIFYAWSVRLVSYAVQLEISNDNKSVDKLTGGKVCIFLVKVMW